MSLIQWTPRKKLGPGARLGLTLNTGFLPFHTASGMKGLALVKDTRLEILAIGSPIEGAGFFSRFMKQAKEEFTEIAVWDIFEPRMHAILGKWGFKPAQRVDDDGLTEGYEWRKT